MHFTENRQAERPTFRPSGPNRGPVRMERIVPNPALKLMDQVREVMWLKHYSIRTERCYCDWIRRYVKFHGMRSREDLAEVSGGKAEMFLRDPAGGKEMLNH